MSSLSDKTLTVLAFPEFYSVGEQADARERLRDALSLSESDLDRQRRQRERSPAEIVTEGTDNAVDE